MGISSVHFNRNLLAAIDVETTGLIPGKHEILQIAVLPLAPDLTLSKHFAQFELRIRPENLSVIDPKIGGMSSALVRDCLTNGMERWAAVDYFNQWFYKTLKLAPKKQIVPLGCNYEAFDYPFLVEFFGGVESYQEYFRSDVRDIQRTAGYINDVHEWHSVPVPFPKVNLTYLASCVDVKIGLRHNALHDAAATAEIYRRMMNLPQFYRPVVTEEFSKNLETLATEYAGYSVRVSEAGKDPMPFATFRNIWEASFGRLA